MEWLALALSSIFGATGIGTLIAAWLRERRLQRMMRSKLKVSTLRFVREHYEALLDKQEERHQAELKELRAEIRRQRGQPPAS